VKIIIKGDNTFKFIKYMNCTLFYNILSNSIISFKVKSKKIFSNYKYFSEIHEIEINC